MVNATHRCDKTVNLKWRPKYSTKSVHLLSILRPACPPHPVKQNWQNGRGAVQGRIPTKLSILGIASLLHQSPGFTPHSNIFWHSNIIVIDFSKPALLGFPPTCDSTLEPGFYRGFSHNLSTFTFLNYPAKLSL